MLDATASRGRVIGTEGKREKLSAIVEGEKAYIQLKECRDHMMILIAFYDCHIH